MLELAEVAAKSLLRHGCWSPQDIEDATQESAMHIWQAMQRKPNAENGYYFRAGFTGAQQWLERQCRRMDAQRQIVESAARDMDDSQHGYHEGRPWDEPLSDERRDQLAAILADCSGKRFRPEQGALIIQLLSRGMTQKEIGEELGKSRWHIGTIRQRIRAVLLAYMEGR